jgi:nuclear protein localization protein 4 homolog
MIEMFVQQKVHTYIKHQLSEVLPKTVDFNTLTLSNAPAGGDARLLKEIVNYEISQIGLG